MSRVAISIDRPPGATLEAGPGEGVRFPRRLLAHLANALAFIAVYAVLIALWRSIPPHH